MNNIPDFEQILGCLNIGVSVVTWHPDAPDRIRWVYVNDARCRLVGMTSDELLVTPPFGQITRETQSLLMGANRAIERHGRFTFETTFLHKTMSTIPVLLHMTLLPRPDEDLLVTEIHDVRSFKETEERLGRARDRERGLIALISEEKRQIARNIQGNIGLVALPLIDQLRVGASDDQREVLDVLVDRIRRVTGKLGVAVGAGPAGAGLTRRQVLICEMIRDGMTSKDIARATGCSPSTVNNHRTEIRRKLGLAGKGRNLEAHLNSLGEELDVGVREEEGLLDDLL